MQKRFVVLGALTCALSLFVGDRAQAAYSYATNIQITSATNGATIAANGLSATLNGVTITFANQSGSKAVPSTNSLNLGDVTVTAGAGAATFSVNFTDTTTITNNPPPGNVGPTGTLAFTGTINLGNVSGSFGTVTATNLTVTQPGAIIGGVGFTMRQDASIPSPSFASPTVNGSGGSVSAVIDAGVIPEPASVVLFGLGMGVMGVVGLRRRFQSA